MESDATMADTLDEVKNVLEATLRMPSGKLDVNADFESFGIDSIIAMELISNLSEKFKVSISPSDFTNVNTVKELSDLLETMTKKNVKVESRPVTAEIKSENIISNAHSAIISEVKNIGSIPKAQRARSIQGDRAALNKVVKYVNESYGVDLSYYRFHSIDEIADVLVNNHFDTLMSSYKFLEITDTIGDNTEEISFTSQKDLPDFRMFNDVAIVGMSCNFPDAYDPKTFWDNLINKKSSLREIPTSRWNWQDYYDPKGGTNKTVSKWAALIKDIDCFDAGFFNVTADEAKLMDPQERVLIQEVYKSFQDGGIDPVSLKELNTGVFLAYEYSEYEQYLRKNIEKVPVGPFGPFFSSSSPTYYLANRLSFLFDLSGPSESFNVNCAGSAVALNRAYYSLLNKECDIAIVGGVSLNLFADDYIALSQYGMLSTSGTCAVFDDNANGFTRGEGAASVVLKRLEDAEKDNNKIYAIVKCCHQSNRGNARFLSELKHEAITKVIQNCYQKVHIEPETISYIEVDGYATKWADSFEYEGIKNVFKDSKADGKYCALGSVKGNIGNMESVSGLASLIKLALSMQKKKFPATISIDKINSFIDIQKSNNPLYIANEEIHFDSIRKNRDCPIRAAFNSFADTGVNVHVILEEYQKVKSSNAIDNSSTESLFIISAKNSIRLSEYVKKYIDFTAVPQDGISLSDLTYTLQVGRESMDERLAIIASSYEELHEKLKLFENAGPESKKELQTKGVFTANTKKAMENPLVSLLTKEMINIIIEQSIKTMQWQTIAQLWISGITIPWKIIWIGKTAQISALPMYPFARERYWIDLKEDTALNSDSPKKNTFDKEIENVQLCYVEKTEWFFYFTEDIPSDHLNLTLAQKVELLLKQEVSLQIHKPVIDIDITKNYLELGMNSIAAITFLSRINSFLHTNISPSLLFIYPDIKRLAEYIIAAFPNEIKNISVTKDAELLKKANLSIIDGVSSENKNLMQPKDIIVPMQTEGKSRPIFAIPGADGSSIALQHLINSLGNEQPFYSIESIGLDGKHTSLGKIEEIAKLNVDAIKTVQPKGPYRLLGYSFGGVVAFAMAKIIVEQNENIEALFLLDTLCPLLPVNDLKEDLCNVFKALFTGPNGKSLDLDFQKFKGLPDDQMPKYLNEVLKTNGYDWPEEQFLAAYNIILSNEIMCRAFKPKKLNKKVDVSLFKSSDGYLEGYSDLPEDYGWNQLLVKPVRTITVPGNHFSIIDKENSPIISENIKTAFNQQKKSKK